MGQLAVTAPAESPPTPRVSGTRRRQSRTARLFIAPFAVLFVGVFVAPIVFAVWQSLFTLHRSNLGLSAPTLKFDPLANYHRLVQDPDFLHSLGRVLLFGVVQVPVMLFLALCLALLIDSRITLFKGFFRLAAFVPYAVPSVVAAIIWSFLCSSTSSPINHVLQSTTGHTIPFFSNGLVLWTVANVVTWAWTGYNMIVLYAALQTIPEELVEAARLDGASAWQIAWHIKVPMVRPALIMTCIFSIIGSAQLYNEPRVLEPISGGAISSTFTPLMAAQSSITGQDYPYAAAESVVLALLVGVLSLAFMKLTARGEQ